MKKFLILIAMFALPAVCSAQFPIHKPSFGVKRQAASSPEVSLSGPAGGSESSALSSNSPATVTFNITNMDESKGVTVDVGQPCHTANQTAQQASPGIYKVALTFDTITSTDTCTIDFHSVANSYSTEIRLFVAATQTDSGIATFTQAKTIVFHTDTGKTIQALVSMRQTPAPGMAMLISNMNDGSIIVTVMAPNTIQVNLNGCMLQGKISGSTASATAMGAMPACNGITSVTIQAK